LLIWLRLFWWVQAVRLPQAGQAFSVEPEPEAQGLPTAQAQAWQALSGAALPVAVWVLALELALA